MADKYDELTIATRAISLFVVICRLVNKIIEISGVFGSQYRRLVVVILIIA